ncbi:hypothetical protein GCM10022408_37440 [Hymenobacter fastidiosus]|uniref:Lipocalin-like domain-containing protein n=1 Tax=Hymenobacter fastidiosus TaxID=486264 RepID=A0ABP7T1T0_9BACT
MKTLHQLTAHALVFIGLVLGGTAAQAQNTIGGAVQQGNGAYVQKTDRKVCITNTLLNVSGIGSCLDMTQEKFMVTPSGNSMSVWTGTVPAASRPVKRQVFNSTWTETFNDGITRNYETVAVTNPNGTIKLTLTDKKNGKKK